MARTGQKHAISASAALLLATAWARGQEPTAPPTRGAPARGLEAPSAASARDSGAPAPTTTAEGTAGARPGKAAPEPPTARPAEQTPPDEALETTAAEQTPLEAPETTAAEQTPPEAREPPAEQTPAGAAAARPPSAAPAARQEPAALPTTARVHIGASHAGTALEVRDAVDEGPWIRVCTAPCDQPIAVEGMLARVVAPGMTPSNPFRIAPGAGTARLRVSGGSLAARRAGLAGLLGGLPVTFGGVALFGIGELEHRSGMRTGGIVALSVGATAVVAALPLLLLGSTDVYNADGDYVAERRFPTVFRF